MVSMWIRFKEVLSIYSPEPAACGDCNLQHLSGQLKSFGVDYREQAASRTWRQGRVVAVPAST